MISDLLNTYHNAEKPFRIEPDPEAKRLLTDFYNSIVDRRNGDLADVGLFASRYAEQAWRIALTFHAVLHGREAHSHSLHPETAQQAITLVDWFIENQLAILAKERQKATVKLEEEVLDFIESNIRRRGRDFATTRDIQQAHIVGTAANARALLTSMEQSGLLVSQEFQPPGGGWPHRRYRTARNPVKI